MAMVLSQQETSVRHQHHLRQRTAVCLIFVPQFKQSPSTASAVSARDSKTADSGVWSTPQVIGVHCSTSGGTWQLSIPSAAFKAAVIRYYLAARRALTHAIKFHELKHGMLRLTSPSSKAWQAVQGSADFR